MDEEQFEAAGQDGTVYTVIMETPVETLETLSGSPTERRGLPTLRLLDGRVLTPVDKELKTFKILDDAGEILTRL
jgi:hypothetical protein